MNQYFTNLLKTLNNSLVSLDEEKFQKLVHESVNALNSDNKIIVSGLGKNVPICDKFVGSMLSLGLNAYFLHTNSAIHGDMGIVKPNDLVIMLTKSGETQESIYLANHLLNKNARLWLLSFNHNSTLTQLAHDSIILDLEHEGDMWNIMPNNSTTINLIILQALVMHIAREMNISINEFKSNHPGGHIGKTLEEAT